MPSLIGNKPNQVPSNGDLGTMAYQDSNAVNITGGTVAFSAGTVSAPSITTTGDTNTGIFFPAADTIAFTEGDVEAMRIDSNGNVGIGTSGPNARLTVVQGSENYALNIQGNSSSQAGVVRFTDAAFTAEQAIISSLNGGGLLFRTGSGSAERMRIDSSGNVGIGITSPGTKLQVNNAGSTDTRFSVGNGNAGFQMGVEASGPCLLANFVAQPIYFATNGTERMRIDSSGNVGIGTSSPSERLTVAGAIRTTITPSNSVSAAVLIANSATTSAANLQLNTDGGLAFWNFQSGGAGWINPVTISTSGNVGIGTSSPNASAILDAQSTTKGVRMPNMTTTQKNAISSPAAGLMIFDTTLAKLCVYSGSAWQTITSV